MAKRKAARAPQRRSGAKKTGAARKATGPARRAKKAVSRKRTAPKRRTAAKNASNTKKTKPARRTPARATSAARPAAARKRTAAKAAKPARAQAKTPRKVVVRTGSTPGSRKGPAIPVRKPPGLDRERRVVRDEDDFVQSTPPSSLDLDRSASAVRSGRRLLKERYEEHTETSPALTAGDVDADWESAYSVGDEAPGGDNPTPDQDIVDDIGRAVGVEYQDNEELKGEEKIAKRDRNRWELDPASSDDWDDR